MMIKLNARTEKDAKTELVKMSKKDPKNYHYAYSGFGLYVTIEKRLHVFAPTDCIFDWYVLNGKVQQFSNKQQAADSAATPILT